MSVFIVDLQDLIHELLHFCLFLPALRFPVMSEHRQVQAFSLLTQHTRLLDVLHVLHIQVVLYHWDVIPWRQVADIPILVLLRRLSLLFFNSEGLVSEDILRFEFLARTRPRGFKLFVLIVWKSNNRLCFVFFELNLDFRARYVYALNRFLTTGSPFQLLRGQSNWLGPFVFFTGLKRFYLKRLISSKMSAIFILASTTLANLRLVLMGLKLANSKIRDGRSS